MRVVLKISVPDYLKNPQNTMDTNVNGTLNVALKTSSKNNVNNFVFASFCPTVMASLKIRRLVGVLIF